MSITFVDLFSLAAQSQELQALRPYLPDFQHLLVDLSALSTFGDRLQRSAQQCAGWHWARQLTVLEERVQARRRNFEPYRRHLGDLPGLELNA